MASADSSSALAQEASPGKAHELQTRAVRLYLVRLSVTLGFRVVSHTHRPHKASLPVRVPTVVSFATDFFRADTIAGTALSFASVAVTAPDHFLSLYDLFMPMLGTRGFCSVKTTDATERVPP